MEVLTNDKWGKKTEEGKKIKGGQITIMSTLLVPNSVWVLYLGWVRCSASQQKIRLPRKAIIYLLERRAHTHAHKSLWYVT